MTLDQAILYEERIANEYAKSLDIRQELEHRQIVEWLRELQRRRASDNAKIHDSFMQD